MNLIEFIGFVFSMVALTFIFLKRYSEERRRRLYPEKYEDMEDEPIILPQKRKQTPPSTPPKREMRKSSESGDHLLSNAFRTKADPSYSLTRSKQSSKAEKIIRNMPSKQELFIIREVLDKPLSLRPPGDSR